MIPVERYLTEVLGPQCGLNADWSVTAWRIAEETRGGYCLGIFILDAEDDEGTYFLTIRTVSEDTGESHHFDVDSGKGGAVADLVTRGQQIKKSLGI